MTNNVRSVKPVRVGLLGTGYWGTRLAKAAAQVPEIEIVSCFSRSDEALKRFVATHGYQAAPSYDAILADPTIEAVLIITPNLLHRDHIMLAIEHGKHIFVDKPITAQLVEGVEVVKAAERAGLVLGLDHVVRLEPPIRRTKEMIERQALGELLMVDSNISSATGLTILPEEWRWERSSCPGGPLTQIGIHHIDALQYLLGPIVRVQGWQKHRFVPAPIDDVTVTLLEFANGVLGYLGSGYASSRSAWIRIYGRAAVAVCDRYEGLRVTGEPIGTKREEWNVPPMPWVDPVPALQEVLRDFARCVRTGDTPVASGRDGLNALAVVLGAVQSQETGKAVDIPALMREAGADW